MADTKLQLVISAKDRASAVIREVKRQTNDLATSSLSSLKRAGGGWGALAGGMGSVKGLVTSLAPSLGLPITLLGGLASAALNGVRLMAGGVSRMVTGALTAIPRFVGEAMRSIWIAQSAVSSLVRGIRNALLAAGALAATVGYVIKSNVDAAAFMEQATIAYGTLLKSMEKGVAFVDQLRQFAATTPFEFNELLTLGRQTLAYGFAAREIIPVLTAVGNAVSALGGSGETMERVLRAIGQIRGKGKVQMQEMYQLAEAGVPVFEIFAQKLGLTQQQIARIGEQGVAASVALPALFAGLNERYGGLMVKQMGTVGGMVSNIQDLLFTIRALAGEAFLPLVKQALPVLAGLLQSAGNRMKVFGDNLATAWAWFTKTKLAAQLVEAFTRLGAILSGLTGRATGVRGLAALITGAAGLILRAVTWLNGFLAGGGLEGVRAWATGLYRFIVGAARRVIATVSAVWAWLTSDAVQGAVGRGLYQVAFWASYLYTVFQATMPKVRKFFADAWGAIQRGLAWTSTNLPGILTGFTGFLASLTRGFAIVGWVAESAVRGVVHTMRWAGIIIGGVATVILFAIEQIIRGFQTWADTAAHFDPTGFFAGVRDSIKGAGDSVGRMRVTVGGWTAGTARAWWEEQRNLPGAYSQMNARWGRVYNAGQGIEDWGERSAAGLRGMQATAAAVAPPPVTVNIQGNVYGVKDLQRAIAEGVAAALAGARYAAAPAG